VRALIASTPGTRVAGDPAIKKALDALAALQQEDGSIFDNPQFVNYITSAATGAFSAAKIPAYRNVEVRARNFLAASQIADDENDASYGGFPYASRQPQPADLSNLQFAVEALADAGLPEDHVVWQRIQTYLSRVQNRSETNSLRITTSLDDEEVTVVSGDDGGAAYGPGMSKAGLIQRPDGTYETRSYGSMTYALLKCLLLAGVDAEDARVVAALGWLTKNFTVDRNPGFEAATDPETAGQQGYFYYLFTLARTLAEYEALTKEPLKVTDAEGREHNWRADVARALLSRVRADGWWVNEKAERWDEGAPVLATSYALQALAEVSGRFR
ncbi:MAG: prenyltransferase/squalene oxidase repeat-containing protein, partial [Planctomycetota bacterium]|jgi:squalene-hopene/tetraprenyl-beta-curcumene cyclase